VNENGKSGESVRILLEKNGKGAQKALEGSHLLIATGRIPNTQGIELELAGVSGYIKVNEHLQTSAAGVWAIGEVADSPQFTHVSIDDFRVVHACLTAGKRATLEDRFRSVFLPIRNWHASDSARRKQKHKALLTACSKFRWRR